ncbi:hypothetical protein LIER_13272 [Lithospermum erythrorhizon]|uniref:Uncharacterized protein n=1 Tax=Lithospermum erythrorhizon TaxID=34254 RepID=A0AAV3PUV0_LITER
MSFPPAGHVKLNIDDATKGTEGHKNSSKPECSTKQNAVVEIIGIYSGSYHRKEGRIPVSEFHIKLLWRNA